MVFKLYHIYDKVKSVMINTNYLFDDIGGITSVWVAPSQNEETDLAAIVGFVCNNGIRTISVPVGIVKKIWPWIESKNIDVIGRFDFNNDIGADTAMSNLASTVTAEFNNGLSGIQVFVPLNQIDSFVAELLPIRDDLLFHRHFSIAIDVDGKLEPDWEFVFGAIKKLRVDSLLIVAHGDKFNVKDDFVGRMFDMLNNWDADCDLHMMFNNNLLRVSQVLRLVQKIRPNLMAGLRVFRQLV